MEKLVFKPLTTKAQIDSYLDKVEHYSGVRLPYSYASNCNIVGVFLQDRLAAGYMLVTKPTFRSLMFVPDSVKKEHIFFNNDDFEMMEINGLWIGPALKTPNLQLRVWSRLILDIFKSRKKFILLMRNSRNKNMERFMGMADPESLYQGKPSLMVGENTHDEIEVSVTTRWKIILNSHKYIQEFMQRNKRVAEYSKAKSIPKITDQSPVNLA